MATRWCCSHDRTAPRLMLNDLHGGGLYLLMAVMLLSGSLIGRRSRMAGALTMTLAWAVIFGAGFVVFAFRDDLGLVVQRLHSEVTGAPVVRGRQMRVPMAIDGHFWIEGEINGVPVNFLVDSGASVTTVSKATAASVGLSAVEGRGALVRTGNGVVRVASTRADSLRFGTVERRDVTIYVADQDDLDVLGMNVLRTFTRWSVEGRWLILEA